MKNENSTVLTVFTSTPVTLPGFNNLNKVIEL